MSRTRLISERDVIRAAREGTRHLDTTGAVVTPCARDAAARLQVSLGGTPSAVERKPRASSAAASAPAASSVVSAPAPVPTATSRRIAVGADHGGVALKDAIAEHLRKGGHRVSDLGTSGAAAVDYPDFAAAVARTVVKGEAELGIMVDGAGIGSCMAANKIRGVRAAMCYDVTTAQNAREHNHANVLTLGGGLIGTRLGLAIVDAFLATGFGGGRHAGRVAKIDGLETGGGT